MGFAERKRLIQELEKVRDSRVVTYVLSDREVFPPGVPGFSASISNDALLFFVDQVRSIGHVDRIDLFLYTRGGATDAVWPLVCLLREHAERVTAIVPFRAHSAGTLIGLGADEIIMSEYAELSPIDPTTGNQFNPPDPSNPGNRFGISVEDVSSYFSLAQERAGASRPEDKIEVLRQLTSTIHPLALGNVERVHKQIRRLAEHLLSLHLRDGEGKKIPEIVRAMTEEFYSHVHAITRREATALLGPWVRGYAEEEREVVEKLFAEYASTLQLKDSFSLPAYMADEPVKPLSVNSALIESTELSYLNRLNMMVMQRPNLPPNVQVQVPPGTPLPLPPWVGRTFEWGIQEVGWVVNSEGI